jgi:hypothetical protein
MKKLDFICPICGGRLLACCFESGSTDYIISKNGKQYKNPIRKASRNCSSIDAKLICCENAYNQTCDFSTNCDLRFDNSYDGKFEITETNEGYKLYALEEDK